MKIKNVFFTLFFLSAYPSYSANNEGYIEASYTYWLAGEEGLNLGRSGDFLLEDDPLFNSVTEFLSQPFQYQSGFKIGAGWIRNQWTLDGKYTFVRNTTSQNSSAPATDPALGAGVWLIAPWFLQLANDGGSLSGTQVGSTWKLGMDIGDLTVSYHSTQSSRFSLYPFAGIRAAWIRQKMDISLTEPAGLFPSLPSQPIFSSTGSNSWAIGPRFGSIAHVCLIQGFRVEANLALSLLFTEYTKVYHTEDPPATDTIPGPLHVSIHNQSVLRPNFDCGLGVGWKTDLCSNRYSLDLSASYDFMLWWNQNMMREMLSAAWNESSSNGNLYLHGLTLSGQFSF